jgi:CRP-like cAMP-binding protein
MNSLKSELDPAKVRTIWDTIRQDNKYFKSLLLDDVKQIVEKSKTLKMFKGDTLCKAGEKVTWFGVILLGRVGVFHNNEKVFTLKVSDIINYMFVIPKMKNHSFDMLVLSPGYISMFFLSDLPSLAVSNPLLYFKLTQLLCLKSIDLISLQYMNQKFIPENTVIWSEYPSKKVQDYINKVPELIQLIPKFFEKNEVKIFQAICKILHLDTGKGLVQEGQFEGCIFLILTGQIFCFNGNDHGKGKILREREVIGFQQFFFNKAWDVSLKTASPCDIIVIHRSVFNTIASKSLSSAIRIYKALHRLYLNEIVKGSRFSGQACVIDVNPSLFFPPISTPNKYHTMSFIDVCYNYNNLIPKNKETPGLFLSLKYQKQAESMKGGGKKMQSKQKLPEKYTKDYLKQLLLRTESGYFSLEEELEDLVLYRDSVKTKFQSLQEELLKLSERNKELKQHLEERRQDKSVLGVKMNHNLVMKDIQNLEEVRSSMKNPYLAVINRSFFDITHAQIKAHRENTLALKYAEKWKKFVKKRKDLRSLKQKNRFWPGE